MNEMESAAKVDRGAAGAGRSAGGPGRSASGHLCRKGAVRALRVAHRGHRRDPKPIRDLERLKWIGVLPHRPDLGLESHPVPVRRRDAASAAGAVLSALILAGGIVMFGIVMAVMLERTQHEILRKSGT